MANSINTEPDYNCTMNYKPFFFSLLLVFLIGCTDKKENHEQTFETKESLQNSSKADGAPAVSCDEILTELVKNSDLISPFKDELEAITESMQGDVMTIRLIVKSDKNVQSENTVGWLQINFSTGKIMDITNDSENPTPVRCVREDWDNFVNCNKQAKNKIITGVEPIKFEDLFNENTVIKFTPAQLNETNLSRAFKVKLAAYESSHPDGSSFDPANLTALINNEVFENSEAYTDSSWLNYLIKKYAVDIMDTDTMELFETAILQEDYNAIKVLVSNGYIVSLKQLQLAENVAAASADMKLRYRNNKGLDEQGDPLFYSVEHSKIMEIKQLLEQKYETNTVSDKDGYVNVRKDKSTSSEAVYRLTNNENFDLLDNTGKWWQVKTIRGIQGYVFRDKIKR